MVYSVEVICKDEERQVREWLLEHKIDYDINNDERHISKYITAVMEEETWEIMKKELNLGITKICSWIVD